MMLQRRMTRGGKLAVAHDEVRIVFRWSGKPNQAPCTQLEQTRQHESERGQAGGAWLNGNGVHATSLNLREQLKLDAIQFCLL